MFKLIIPLLLITSCASDFSKYKSRTDYNLMQCQKMCSAGNIVQIEKFNCACNLTRNGNTTVIYNRAPASQNSGFQQFLNGMAQWGAQSDANRQRQYLNQSSGWTDKGSSVVPNRYAPSVPASNVFGILGD